MKNIENSCCCSVPKLYPTLNDPMDCKTPGFPVLHYLPESAQTHVHWFDDAIQPSHSPLPLLLLPSVVPTIRVFPISQLFASDGQRIRASASASVRPIYIQGWFPLGLSALITLLFKGLSKVFSSTTVWKHQFFSTQPSLWSNSQHPYMTTGKDHSFDYMDLCWQRDVSAFYCTV